jgi:hypothetical protein
MRCLEKKLVSNHTDEKKVLEADPPKYTTI